MKISKKILLGIVGFMLVFVISGLVQMKRDMKAVLAELALENRFETLEIDSFSEVDFTGSWHVIIRQGKNLKVDVAADRNVQWENMDGILTFTASNDSININKAKITVPAISVIRADKSSVIELKKFELDTLSIVLGENSTLRADYNNFKFIALQTLGSSSIKLTDDGM